MIPHTKNIILAEDDEDDSQFFEDALQDLQDAPQYIRARDGAELTGLLSKMDCLPDLVFLDLNMPKKNGTQCLQEIRNSTTFSKLPVVVLSTTSSPDIIETIYRTGANLYVVKPNTMAGWRKAIAKVLSMDWNIQTPHPVKEKFKLTTF